MNEEQYLKWKAETFRELVNSETFNLEEARVIVDWFDTIDYSKEEDLMGVDWIEKFNGYVKYHFSIEDENFVAKVLPLKAWLYAGKILGDLK